MTATANETVGYKVTETNAANVRTEAEVEAYDQVFKARLGAFVRADGTAADAEYLSLLLSQIHALAWDVKQQIDALIQKDIDAARKAAL